MAPYLAIGLYSRMHRLASALCSCCSHQTCAHSRYNIPPTTLCFRLTLAPLRTSHNYPTPTPLQYLQPEGDLALPGSGFNPIKSHNQGLFQMCHYSSEHGGLLIAQCPHSSPFSNPSFTICPSPKSLHLSVFTYLQCHAPA